MRWIVLLRAVNVGGTGILPMARLRSALEAAGACGVASYIQSGNLLFDLDAADAGPVRDWMAATIAGSFGLSPGIIVLTRAELDETLNALPWPEDIDPARTLVVFHDGPANRDAVQRLRTYCTQDEEVVQADRCLFVHYPNGAGRSQLTGRIEKALGRPATARNLNTLRRVLALA